MKPIINSLLDIDFYKFTMGQFIFNLYPQIPVKFAFKNRTTKVRLADRVDEQELQEQLDHLKTLIIFGQEYDYLESIKIGEQPMFSKQYPRFLLELELCDYYLEKHDGQYILEFSGPWSRVTYSETLALAIISELYTQAMMRVQGLSKRDIWTIGEEKLLEKIEILKKYPGITFADFGHRRRSSFDWHEYEVEILKNELPKQFIGTSDTYLAWKYDLMSIGTNAHELQQVLAALAKDNDEAVRQAPYKVAQDWWNLYGWDLSIILPDTFGTSSFLTGVTKEQAQAWKGFRQDSGDPFEIGERTIVFYQQHGINSKDKLLIFSDGLEVPTMIKLYEQFSSRIRVSFGWGTNLTNDVGIKPLSLVIKVVEADGQPAVKLSDNLEKAIGTPQEIERYKKIFGYQETYNQKCTY